LTPAPNDIDGIATTNALGVQIATNTYNAYHQILTNYDALNQLTVYTYNANHLVTSITTPSGLTTTNIYGADNRVQITIDLRIGRTNSYTYTNGLMFTHTDERGLTVSNSWDALQRLTNVAYPDGTSMTYIYANLDLVKVVDRMGFTTSYGYDSMRRKVAETNALGAVTIYTYCTCGSLDSITDAATNTTHYYYDNIGRMTNATYPDGFGVTNSYNLLDQLTNVTDSSGTSITNWFDNQGLQVAVSNSFGLVKSMAYDVLDRDTNDVDANGVAVSTAYDNLNRVLSRSYPDGGVESFGYSARGLIAYTNQLGLTNFYGYDAAMRKTFETNANHEITQFLYDPSGNLTNLVDGKGQNTFWFFDQYDRVTNKVDNAGTSAFIYGYDPDNRLTNRTSAAKGTTQYRYDAVGNLTNVIYPINTNLAMAYDVLNRMTNMVDAVGTTRYVYDAAGQLLSEGGLWNNDTVSYTYQNRLRTGLSLLAPNADPWAQSYGYDPAKRLTSLSSPAGAFSYAYDPVRNLQVSNLALPNGAYIRNAYDNVARMLSTKLVNSSGTALDSQAYAYNQGSQRTAETNLPGDYRNYTYDNIGQLKTANAKEPGGVTNRLQEQFGYAYDAAGNLNWRTNNALLQAFNVNSLNELTTETNSDTLTVAGTTTSAATDVTVNGVTATNYLDATFAKDGFTPTNGNNAFTAVAQDSYGRKDTNSITCFLPGTNTFTYDLNGNLLSDGSRYFAYDDENQLISAWVTNAWQSTFAYDGKMRRRIRREYTWQGAAWVQTNAVNYIYDGNVVIEERDINNLPKTVYTRGPDLSGTLQGAGGIGGLLARTDVGLWTLGLGLAHAYYHSDGNGNGNVTCLINTNQAIVAKYLYDPFGNILSQCGSLADENLYRFSGKEYHPNSGLLYYLYRFYASSMQRWSSRDPIEEQGGLNLYEFCLNSPVSAIDIFGRGTWQPDIDNNNTPDAYIDVYYTFDATDYNHCRCTKGVVDRYLLKTIAPSVGAYIPDETKGLGGYWDATDGSAHAEGDSPEGIGLRFVGRLPNTYAFLWKARCTAGPDAGKILSELKKTLHVNGHKIGGPITYSWVN